MFGAQVQEAKIKFAWPSPEHTRMWGPEVFLQALEVKTHTQGSSYISSVRCIMSNGESSPVFTKEGMHSVEKKIITFDPVKRPVRYIQAWDNCHSTRRLTFLDKNENEIDYYDPSNNYAREGTIHELAPNEEIIGVYGGH